MSGFTDSFLGSFAGNVAFAAVSLPISYLISRYIIRCKINRSNEYKVKITTIKNKYTNNGSGWQTQGVYETVAQNAIDSVSNNCKTTSLKKANEMLETVKEQTVLSSEKFLRDLDNVRRAVNARLAQPQNGPIIPNFIPADFKGEAAIEKARQLAARVTQKLQELN